MSFSLVEEMPDNTHHATNKKLYKSETTQIHNTVTFQQYNSVVQA